ncbi:MAG: hypothetical protein LLG04_04735 [Parachlamydia sp.]|nr:hypothetical protein [Parachlamydia sp.]
MMQSATFPSGISTQPKQMYAPTTDFFKNQLAKVRFALNNALASSKLPQPADWWKSLPEVRALAAQDVLKNVQKASSVAFAGPMNPCLQECLASLSVEAVPVKNSGPCDLIVASHSLDGEMESILKASEELLLNPSLEVLQRHPIYQMISRLRPDGSLLVTHNSGPNIQDFTHIMLQKHDLDFDASTPDLKIFSNVETFLRCFDIFKRHYEQLCGQSLACDVSYSMPKIPLQTFCEGYSAALPEIAKLPENQRERYVKLISAFIVDDHVIDCNLTLKISPKSPQDVAKRSFKPVGDFNSYRLQHKQSGSNEISFGQLDKTKQIQNLNGSELAIPFIKEADGEAQDQAIQRLFKRQKVNMLDIGGSYGETNAVPQALAERGIKINLLNIDPEERTFESYAQAHQRIGVQQVHSLPKRSQDLDAKEVMAHFGGEKVDLIFSSHALYFEIADMMQASLDPSRPLSEHPLYKYFQMLADDGVFVVTMQTGAGSRVFRNALLGDHGLDGKDEIAPTIESFKNIGAALRYLEQFKIRFKQETGKTIQMKLHSAVANVPLGDMRSSLDNPESLERRMLEFYGNWESLKQTIDTSPDAALRDKAMKTQKVFRHILPAFAPGLVNMQHPNITLEITIEK